MFVLSVYTSKKFLYFLDAYMYISPDNLTIHLKMTEVWSKRRVLPFVYIVKNRNELDFTLKKAKQWSRQHARYSLTQISTTVNVFFIHSSSIGWICNSAITLRIEFVTF